LTIPNYQTLMSPALKIASDGKEHGVREITERLAVQARLSEQEKAELLPSGRRAKFANRVGWALTHLKKAKVLDSTERGKWQITQRGVKLFEENPTGVDNDVLSQFPEFREFKQWTTAEETTGAGLPEDPDLTGTHTVETPTRTYDLDIPREALEWNYKSLRDQLASDLLEQTKKCSPSFFERMVVALLVAMGYGGSLKDAGRAIGRSGDGGVDGLIKQDKLGLDAVYIQAKRWDKGIVGSPELQKFVGSLEGHHATKGVFITTSKFSEEAKRYLDKVNKKVVLVEGKQLAELMIDYGIGATEDTTYTVKKLDPDYFFEE